MLRLLDHAGRLAGAGVGTILLYGLPIVLFVPSLMSGMWEILKDEAFAWIWFLAVYWWVSLIVVLAVVALTARALLHFAVGHHNVGTAVRYTVVLCALNWFPYTLVSYSLWSIIAGIEAGGFVTQRSLVYVKGIRPRA